MRVVSVSILFGSLVLAAYASACRGGSRSGGDGGADGPNPADCGNGRLDPGEACDPEIAAGDVGACPTTCPMDTNACTSDVVVGSAATCSASCAVTACEPGDGCCPGGCNAIADTDCAPVCGNGIVEPGEFCDGSCPTSCDDGDDCTADSLTGTECTRACEHEGIPMCGPRALDDVLRINHIQMKGTHNSFHLRPAIVHPDWDYEHAPLDVQFESQGVRAIELDVFWNWISGRFDCYHVYWVDDESTCRVFQDCLRTIRAWSDAHPYHHPILVQIEPKDDGANDIENLETLEEEILEILPRHQAITPDDVRGSAATLRDAVTMTGWPTLRASRGKILFFLDCGRDVCVEYANGGASLDGRVIFAASQASDTWAGVMVINNPGMAVTTAAQAGYLVRTRAFDVGDAQDNDYSGVAPALASGGHIISTDIPAPVPEYEQHLTIPGGTPSRCNPVTAPVECTSLAIEDPSALTN